MQKIKVIIFDLGGVILNLDQERTIRAFARMGADLEQVNLDSHLFTDFEKGLISPDEFRNQIKKQIKGPTHDNVINDAWNAMLLDIPKQRLDLIAQLRRKFKIGLLSNTNKIHIDYFNDYLKAENLDELWNSLFDKVLLSFEIGMRKPDLNIYEHAVQQFEVAPEQCLFIDDNHSNIVSANKIGIQTIWANQPIGSHTLNDIKEKLSMSL